MREAALGVQRAVDRVDDDEHAGIAEVDDAALLGDEREARAVRRAGARSCVDDEVLGELIEHQRAVAADAHERPSRAPARAPGGWAASTSRRPSAERRQAPSQSYAGSVVDDGIRHVL